MPKEIPEGRRLYQIMESLRKDVDQLKSSASSPQLGSSSIDVFQGRGFIPIMENGVEKHRIGRQPDGTITSVSKNNENPPQTPKAPVCVPFIGGVTVTCTGFLGNQFLDFSHVRVYVDDQLTDCIMKVPGAVAITPLDPGPHTFYLKSVNLSNTASPSSEVIIASPNLVVGTDITDGIIDELKLKDDAVTNAKLAAQAVTGSKIAAETIEGSMIAAETIFAENIAAGQVTTEKLQALAVIAEKIAANAVEAGHIKAGSVTAEKLAAQIILAGTAIIVGNPVLARLVLDQTGMTQVDEFGNISLQIGASPGQGNYLTVIDSTDPSNALLSIGRDGSITVNGINITGTAYLNGIDLVDFLNQRPQGIVARATYLGEYSPGTSSEVGLIELAVQVIGGRSYRIQSSTFGAYGARTVSNIKFTTNNTIPTINSPLMSRALAFAGDYDIGTGPTSYKGGNPAAAIEFETHNHGFLFPEASGQHTTIYTATSSVTLRLLLTVAANLGGAETWQGIGIYSTWTPAYIRTPGILQLFVEDLGVLPMVTGGSNSGGGTTNAVGQYVRVFSPTYTRYGTPASINQNGLQQGLAGSTTYVSMIGFDQSQMQTALSGATIDKVELYLYANYWSLAEGGYVCIGTHNVSGSAPTTYSFVQRDLKQQAMKKPQGLWIELPSNIATNLAAGSIKGLVFDSRASYPSASNYGVFREMTYTDATVRPSLRVTYRK